MRALRFSEWRTPPELVEVPDPVPGPGEVVIRIGGAGVCHSDLHIIHEYEPGALPWQLPFTLGHENAGWVEAVGAEVHSVQVGDAVAVFGPWGCGRCASCADGSEAYCDSPHDAPVISGGGGLGLDGGMADFMVVPCERHLVRLPEGLSPVAAAPLTDAGLTPYHAIRRSWPKLTPNATIAVIGVGGLGHLGVQIARATTSARIIAVDRKPEALALASEMGADDCVLSGDGAASEIRELTAGRGAEVVIDFVGAAPTIELARAIARRRGDITIVGVAGGQVPFSFFTQAFEVNLTTTVWGTRTELVELLELASRGRISVKASTYALSNADQAYRDLEAGTVVGRAVVVPD